MSEKRKQVGKPKSLQQSLPEPIGTRLKNARLQISLTQQDVADALGTSPQMISFLEKGSQGFTIDYLIFLRSKGVDINRIFSDLKP